MEVVDPLPVPVLMKQGGPRRKGLLDPLLNSKSLSTCAVKAAGDNDYENDKTLDKVRN